MIACAWALGLALSVTPVGGVGAGEPVTFSAPEGWMVMPLPGGSGGLASIVTGRFVHGFMAMSAFGPPGATDAGAMPTAMPAMMVGGVVEPAMGDRLDREAITRIVSSVRDHPMPNATPGRIVSSSIERIGDVECARLVAEMTDPMGTAIGSMIWYIPAGDRVAVVTCIAPTSDATAFSLFEEAVRATRGARAAEGAGSRARALVVIALLAVGGWYVWSKLRSK